MTPIARNELILMRHAPADHGGRLCGRTDVAALLPDEAALVRLRAGLAGVSVVTSPARRCRETAAALFPPEASQAPALTGQASTGQASTGRAFPEDARLWEQDFGVHDGRAFGSLPDLGRLSLDALARHAAEGAESFLDMVARVRPALRALADQARTGGPVLVVAHAGTARAALGIALEAPASALKFEIAALSLTRLRCHEDGLSIVAVNERHVP